YFLSGEINLTVENPKVVIEKLKEKYFDGKINKIDGVTIEYPDWWFNLRSSNTEPVVRLNIEAGNENMLDDKKQELLKNII
ncbi:phosphomannomutase, partial [Candidatus Berkelbacteria bacterium CG08_land_8_20_14_0_20_39_8]